MFELQRALTGATSRALQSRSSWHECTADVVNRPGVHAAVSSTVERIRERAASGDVCLRGRDRQSKHRHTTRLTLRSSVRKREHRGVRAPQVAAVSRGCGDRTRICSARDRAL